MMQATRSHVHAEIIEVVAVRLYQAVSSLHLLALLCTCLPPLHAAGPPLSQLSAGHMFELLRLNCLEMSKSRPAENPLAQCIPL